MNKIFIRHEYGQLGNILFRLANTLGFALEHGYRVEDYTFAFCNYHDGSSNIQFLENYHAYHFFEYPRSPLRIINRIKWKFRNRGLRKTKLVENFDPTFDLQKLDLNCSYELKGFHFSSGGLAFKHRSQICKILRFRESETLPVQNLLNDYKKEHKVLLGLHMRQNDYKTFYDGKYFVSADQYLKAVNHFKSLYPHPESIGVVICSDEKETLLNIQKDHPDYIYPKGNIAKDMYALSWCDYIIGPKGTTMSAWAAYIGESSILQIDQSTQNFELESFSRVKRLEPFNPSLN